MAQFAVGEIVSLRADVAQTGAVIQVLSGNTEVRYIVFHDGRTATYYESQLQSGEAASPSHNLVPFPEFRARLTALEITQPSLSTLYSLNAARVQFVPYQYRPVLKFIGADRPRLLIADEVGVGKTIEAGLILRELQSRREVQNVLIICPKPLVTERKWQLEMERFDEEFHHLDGATLRHCLKETDLNGVWPDRYAKSILPFSLFDEQLVFGGEDRRGKRTQGLLDLDPPPHFDLVIVDEAHHLRNPGTFLHQGVRFLCENAEAILFLTATPIQLRSTDLFVLLNLLRPDLILDSDTFEYMSSPNPFINAAVDCARAASPGWEVKARQALLSAGETEWGQLVLRRNPGFNTANVQLSAGSLSSEERLSTIQELENLHTFSHLINRTRRRDIGSFTTRKPETVLAPFTESQERLHDALLAAQARTLEHRFGNRMILFMMSTLRRQAASCLYGLAPMMRKILTRGISDLEWDEIDEAYEVPGDDALTAIAAGIGPVLEQAENLDEEDPKLERLLRIIHDKRELSNNKILLFSSFIHTLHYLDEQLVDAGVRIALIHGGTPDEDRRDLRHRFSLPPADPHAIDLLLSSEVGCEGLDYQFCDCLVNYDIPWNPMRIEQRIGRIDRYGQESPVVAIYNFITPGTVDAEIYERCHQRIGVFRQALGGSEEVLGRLTSELRSIAENLALSEQERAERFQQLADNEIRVIQEQAALEERQAEFFGIMLPPDQMAQQVMESRSVWLSPEALQNLAAKYLATHSASETPIIGEGTVKALRLSHEARGRLLDDFQKLPRQKSPVYRQWEKWLKGPDPRLEITFDAKTASQERSAVLIGPTHPLAQQAAAALSGSLPLCTVCRVQDGEAPHGRYPFTVYQWRKIGIREDVALVPICDNAAVSSRLLKLLEKAAPLPASDITFPSQGVFENLEQQHYLAWSDAKAEHLEKTARIADYRRESLRASHQSRLALLTEQLAQSENRNIRRMRESQINNAEVDCKRRMEEIEAAGKRADILSEPVAFGVIVVEAIS